MINKRDTEVAERREFVRINVSLPVRCRKIKEEDLRERQEELALRPSNPERMSWNTGRMADKRRNNTDNEGDFNILSLQLLWDITHKLDRLINLLEHKEDRDIEEWEAKALDLSGSGMRIISSREINVDEYLQMEMSIPLFPITVIACIGEIVWVESIVERDMVRWVAGLRFTAINEYDREEIIRFVFQQQRMLLRARVPHGSQT